MIRRIGRFGYPCPGPADRAWATANEAQIRLAAAMNNTVNLLTMRLPSSRNAARAARNAILPRGAGIQPGTVR